MKGPQDFIIPMVTEVTARSERTYDLFSRLMKDRIVFIGSEINDLVANVVIGQLLYLQNENKNQDINVYINSPGGSVTAGLAVYDTMQFVTCKVATYCVGQAASMACVLLAAGTPGKRFALPHSRLMLHQPWGGMQGSASDILIHSREIERVKKQINLILSRHTGKGIEQIETDTDRDFFMEAEEAKAYGLVDEVIVSAKEAERGGEKT
ncbi:MAG: ATP-dependent Clp protease proteolytic subunit [Planctomycetota bacterium]